MRIPRITITRAEDGHLLVTREVPRAVNGSSRDRRMARRAKELGEWRRLDRTIYRSGSVTGILGSGLELLPMGSLEIDAIALSNHFFAQGCVEQAEAQVAAIEAQLAGWMVPKPKHVRVTIEEIEPLLVEEA